MKKNKKGQATLEYILMISFAVVVYKLLGLALDEAGLAAKLMRPIQVEYARAYQYGHPKTKGYEDPGGPEKHIRHEGDRRNFRIFKRVSR